MIRGTNTSFRVIKNDEDELLFQSLKDWPADRVGPITRKRAMDVIDEAMRQHENIEIPITDDSDFYITFVITNGSSDKPIGTTQGRIKNRSAYISWISLFKEERGLGLFKEIHFCWSELAFKIMNCDRIIFITGPSNVAVINLGNTYTYDKEEARIGLFDTADPKEKFVQTKANHLADFARLRGYKDAKGQPLSFKVIPEEIPQKRIREHRPDGRPEIPDVESINRQKPDVVHHIFQPGPERGPEPVTQIPLNDPEL